MYKKKIEQYIEAHKQEMLDDICTLCSINSERSAAWGKNILSQYG